VKPLDNNKKKHEIALFFIRKMIAKRQFWNGALDAAGGRLPPGGFRMRRHGGIFAPSSDRLSNGSNQDVHFRSDKLYDNNIQLIAAGMNHSCNIAAQFKSETCKEIRMKIKESNEKRMTSPQSMLNAIIERESMVGSKLYWSANGAYNADKACQEEFQHDFRSFFNYCLEILRSQMCSCETTTILLEEEGFFQTSVDAINPCLGHVRGNIRLVCQFTNNANCDKKKTYEHEDDRLYPSAWTRELFFAYVGLGKWPSYMYPIN